MVQSTYRNSGHAVMLVSLLNMSNITRSTYLKKEGKYVVNGVTQGAENRERSFLIVEPMYLFFIFIIPLYVYMYMKHRV